MKKKKKVNIRNSLANLFIFTAIMIMVVVLMGNFLLSRKMKTEVNVFENEASQEEVVSMLNEIDKLKQEEVEKLTAKEKRERKEYLKKQKEVLKQYEKPIGVLEVPKVRVELPIYYNTTEENLSKGTSILKKGDFLTDNGTVEESFENFEDDYNYTLNVKNTDKIVITGHNSTSSVNNHDMLKNIEYLEKGDFFYINNGKDIQKFKVKDYKIVLPSEANEVYEGDIDFDAMLLTCHPYTINSHRLLIYGEYEGNVDNATKELELKELEKMSFFETYNPYNLIIIFVLIILIIYKLIKFIKNKKIEKNEEKSHAKS